MWLKSSSIGRKLVMAITGACLVLFVTFHAVMNSVAIFWPTAYNVICEFLGANWYALIATVGLAALFVLHIIYAIWLTLQNRRARGPERYVINARQPQVEWSSKNMLVLGIVVVAFLVVHLIQFWSKMQLAEITHCPVMDENGPVLPQLGTRFLEMAFSQIYTPIIYIIGFIALWFHLNHGFWSMFQSCGWNNTVWINRLKTISCWWTSIVVLMFVAQAIVFTVQARSGFYSTNPALIEQYQAAEAAHLEVACAAARCEEAPCAAAPCAQEACTQEACTAADEACAVECCKANNGNCPEGVCVAGECKSECYKAAE